MDWKIPNHMFPLEEMVSDMYIHSEGAGEIERGSQTAYWNRGNSLAGYDIYRYPTIKRARMEYERRLGQLVDDETNRPWVQSKEFTFSSATADEMFMACGDWLGRRCGFLARYQEYVIFFDAVMDEEMTYDDFKKIVLYLDEQISSRLYP